MQDAILTVSPGRVYLHVGEIHLFSYYFGSFWPYTRTFFFSKSKALEFCMCVWVGYVLLGFLMNLYVYFLKKKKEGGPLKVREM